MRAFSLIFCAFLIVGSFDPLFGQATPRTARSTMEKWVQTRQLIASEQSQWISEKDAIEQSIQLYASELEKLTGQIAESSTSTSKVIEEENALKQEKDELIQATDRLMVQVSAIETRLKSILKTLPVPLSEKVDPLSRRIPEDPSDTRISLSQRLQNIVGILSELEKFNGAISVFSELRKNASGAEVQVKTLYLGLAQAYFVDTTGEFAGVGSVGDEGWTWETQSDLGSQIQKAIAIYESAAPAAFVNLPISVE